MVDHSWYGTNSSYYIDIIEFSPKPYVVQSSKLLYFYQKKGLSAKQVADELGVSKSFVLERLHELGIRSRSGQNRMMNPENYRHHNPPFGYQVKNGKLLPYKPELKVCRLIVQMIRDKGYGFRETARELEKRGLKNRKGQKKWGHYVVTQIFNRWKEKL